jgi:hypothetical protein
LPNTAFTSAAMSDVWPSRIPRSDIASCAGP